MDSGFTGMTIRRAINALDSNHDSATTQLRTDIANSFRYQTISGDTGSDTVDSASGSLAIVGDTSLSTTVSGNRVVIDHSVTGATDVDNSGKTYVQDITMDSAGHVTAIGSTAISGLDNNDIAAGAGINAEKIHDGTISNTEFGHLNGVSSNIQTQLDNKVINNPTVTLAAGTGLSGGGSFTANQSGNSTITFNGTAVSNSTVTIVAGTNLSGGGSFSLNGGGGTYYLNFVNNSGYLTTNFSNGGNISFNNGYGSNRVAYGVRAWIMYSHSSGIRGRGDTSTGAVDFGVGFYAITFAAMPDNLYCIAGMGKSLNGNHNPSSMSEHLSYTRTTTACYILTGATGGTSSYSFGGDVSENSVCIIR